MNEIQQWLINIQARAPNSPVIIVGTHMDVVKDEFPPSFSEYLQQRIREKFINITDPEKFGLSEFWSLSKSVARPDKTFVCWRICYTTPGSA